MPTKKKPDESDAIRNESDVDLYYPALGVTLKPGETYQPQSEKE